MPDVSAHPRGTSELTAEGVATLPPGGGSISAHPRATTELLADGIALGIQDPIDVSATARATTELNVGSVAVGGSVDISATARGTSRIQAKGAPNDVRPVFGLAELSAHPEAVSILSASGVLVIPTPVSAHAVATSALSGRRIDVPVTINGRLVFPDPATGLTYLPTGGAGFPLLNAEGTVVTLYTDAAMTQPADIRDMLGAAIPNSEITVQADSTLPNFFGPDDGTDLLYDNFGNVIVARVDDRLDFLGSAVQQAMDASANNVGQHLLDGHAGYITQSNLNDAAFALEADILEVAADAAADLAAVAATIPDLLAELDDVSDQPAEDLQVLRRRAGVWVPEMVSPGIPQLFVDDFAGDDIDKINACIAEAYVVGDSQAGSGLAGARIALLGRTYNLADAPLLTTDGCRAQVPIPNYTGPATSFNLEIVGRPRRTTLESTLIGVAPYTDSDGVPSIIGAPSANRELFTAFNAVNLKIRGVNFQQPEDGELCDLDARGMNQLDAILLEFLSGVRLDDQTLRLVGGLEPTHPCHIAILPPDVNNPGQINLRSCRVYAHYGGFGLVEHLNADDLYVYKAKAALVTHGISHFHSTDVGYVSAESCQYNLAHIEFDTGVTSPPILTPEHYTTDPIARGMTVAIRHLDIEESVNAINPGRWENQIAHVLDANNVYRGEINYSITTGGIGGRRGPLTVTGGRGLLCHDLREMGRSFDTAPLPINVSSDGAFNPGAGIAYLLPVSIDRGRAVGGLLVDVDTAGGTAEFGLYRDDPTQYTRVMDGTITVVNATGVLELPLTADYRGMPGGYVLAVVLTNPGAQLRTQSGRNEGTLFGARVTTGAAAPLPASILKSGTVASPDLLVAVVV